MILSFHTWSSFIHLNSSALPSRLLPSLPPFTPSRSVFLPLHRLIFSADLFLPFSAGFPFSLRFFLSSQRYGRSPSAFSRGRSGGMRNYMYAPGLPASASPAHETWKQVRYTQPRSAGRLRGTVPRCTCISSRYWQGHDDNNTEVSL